MYVYLFNILYMCLDKFSLVVTVITYIIFP